MEPFVEPGIYFDDEDPHRVARVTVQSYLISYKLSPLQYGISHAILQGVRGSQGISTYLRRSRYCTDSSYPSVHAVRRAIKKMPKTYLQALCQLREVL